MFLAPFFFQQAGTTLSAPVLSNRTVLARTDTVNQWGNTATPLAFPYTSASGNVLMFGCTRSMAATTRGMVEDWNGDAMAEVTTAKQDLSNNLRCEIGLKTAGLVGAGNVHVSGDDVNNRFLLFLGWAYDLDQVRGGVGAKASSVIAVSQTFVEVSLAVQQVGSLLVAAAWNQNEDTRPWVWSPGWTQVDEQILGTGNQVCGALATKTSTAAGAEAVRMTGDTAHGTWAIAAVEFLRG